MCSLSLLLHAQAAHPVHGAYLTSVSSSPPSSVSPFFSCLFSCSLHSSSITSLLLCLYPVLGWLSLAPLSVALAARLILQRLSPPMSGSGLGSVSISHQLCLSPVSVFPARAVSFFRIATLYGSMPGSCPGLAMGTH